MKKTRLYIGIETKVRELDGKLLLSCVAAEAGYDVVLGQQKMFLKRLGEMPEGILLNKSISPSKARKYAHYKKLGFKLVAYDEEGLAPLNADEYQKRRVSVDSLTPLDYFFAWGPWQKDVILEKAPRENAKIVPVGHPRIDLTRRELRSFYDDEVKTLRDRYGQFVLINTNFSFYNHFQGRDFEVILRQKTKAGKIADEKQRECYRKVSEHKKVLFYEFAEMVVKIHERFPSVTIVLRPHPSEDHEYWKQVLPKDEKIHVVHEGNVIPWIKAANVMIHNSCSTGIEGYLLEQPVISYRPVQAEELEIPLPNLLSEQALTLDALLDMLEQYLTNNRGVQETVDDRKQEIASRYITGLDGLLSCERIVASLNTVQIPKKTVKMASYQLYTKMKNMKSRSVGMFRQRAKETHKMKYRIQKFPGIALDEVQQAISKFHSLTGRFSNVRANQLEKNLLQITRVE
jgi:surface carbohydrate biosynthesis protein